MLHRRKQEAPEFSLKLIRARVGFGSQKISKETLSQILRIRRGVTAPANETVNWRPIRFAELSKSLCCLRRIRESQLRNNAPVRGGKTRAAFLERARSPFHVASITMQSRLLQENNTTVSVD